MSESLPPAALQALQQGRMIEAIKIVRTEHNLGFYVLSADTGE
ncbi:MAG: hypothetical protein WA154_07650 [Moraxellaceae bacterium]